MHIKVNHGLEVPNILNAPSPTDLDVVVRVPQWIRNLVGHRVPCPAGVVQVVLCPPPVTGGEIGFC